MQNPNPSPQGDNNAIEAAMQEAVEILEETVDDLMNGPDADPTVVQARPRLSSLTNQGLLIAFGGVLLISLGALPALKALFVHLGLKILVDNMALFVDFGMVAELIGLGMAAIGRERIGDLG